MPTNEQPIIRERLSSAFGELEHEIRREEKGTIVSFYPNVIVKQYGLTPAKLNEDKHHRRFQNELSAYHAFQALKCTFVPNLKEFSEAGLWFAVQRVHGTDLLSLTQNSQKFPISFGALLKQLRFANDWLRDHEFWDLGTNLKDIILGVDRKIYIVDFEKFAAQPNLRNSLFDSLIIDVLGRLLIRRGRTAKLTLPFLTIVVLLFAGHPLKLAHHIYDTIFAYWWNAFRTKLARAKMLLKRALAFFSNQELE